MCLLVLGTPGFDDIADVSALVLHLCVVAHDDRKESCEVLWSNDE